MPIKSALTIFCLCIALIAQAQTQLVLVHRDKVIARFEYGDDFIYKPKNSKKYVHASMLGATEFGVILFNDTIPFVRIDRVSLKGHPQRNFASLAGSFLITAGVAYFVLDQVNHVIVQGQKADLDPAVWKPSLILVASGVALRLAHKRSQRIRFPAKLIAAEYGSRFYKPIE